MKAHGIPFMDFVDLLDKYGYGSIEGLQKLEPNPLKWNKNQWLFAVELIMKATGKPEAKIRNLSPTELLYTFNECMRKTGLVVELVQSKTISEREVFPAKWEEEWRNVNPKR